MDRLGQTMAQDPVARQNGTIPPQTPQAAPEPQKATPTPPKTSDAPETVSVPKTATPEVKETTTEEKPKAKASDLLKQLAAGEKKEADKPVTPPTPEQKKEYTMKELRLRAEKADALDKELADARKELEAAKAAHADPEQIKLLTEERDAIKAEREEYKKKLAALDVMQSDEYQTNVTKPMEAIWQDLSKSAEDFKFNIRDLASAIQIPDHRQRLAAISKVLDSTEGDLDPMNRYDLVNAANEFLRREAYGAQLLANSSKTQEALKADRQRKEAEEKEVRTQSAHQQAEQIFKQMFSEESLADMPFLAEKAEDGTLKPNKELLSQIRKAATFEKEPWRMALDSYSTELLPVVMEYAKEKDARIKELEDRVAALSGAGPKPGGVISHEGEGDPDSNLTLAERIEKTQRSQGMQL